MKNLNISGTVHQIIPVKDSANVITTCNLPVSYTAIVDLQSHKLTESHVDCLNCLQNVCCRFSVGCV